MPSSPFLVLFFVATTLTLAHTAPDTETLIMVDGPFQALFTDFTLGANPLRILSHRFKLHTRNVILSSFPVSMPIFQKIHAKVQPNLGSTVAESVKIGH